MDLTVLVLPGCPHAALLDQRLAELTAERADLTLTHELITDAQQAAEVGMRGSPTLLIDGVDPFAQPGQRASLSCRIYRDASGRAEGAPSIEALRCALEQASR